MPDYKFGLSGSWFIDLVYFKEDPIPAFADEAEDKITSKPTETVHSPSSPPSLSSVETQHPLHPLAASTSSFCPQVTDQPTLQLATPPESAPSNSSPHAESGETLFPATFPNFFSLGNILDSFIQHYIDLAFRYSMACVQHHKCCHRSLVTCLGIKWQHLCHCIHYNSFKTKRSHQNDHLPLGQTGCCRIH